jgi:hypothetical protein
MNKYRGQYAVDYRVYVAVCLVALTLGIFRILEVLSLHTKGGIAL